MAEPPTEPSDDPTDEVLAEYFLRRWTTTFQPNWNGCA